MRRTACDVGALSLRRFSAILAVALHLIHPAEGVGWSELSASGAPPKREGHSAVWSSVANGFYLFAGWAGSGASASPGPGELKPGRLAEAEGATSGSTAPRWAKGAHGFISQRKFYMQEGQAVVAPLVGAMSGVYEVLPLLPCEAEACYGVLHERPTPGPICRLADHPLHGPAM